MAKLSTFFGGLRYIFRRENKPFKHVYQPGFFGRRKVRTNFFCGGQELVRSNTGVFRSETPNGPELGKRQAVGWKEQEQRALDQTLEYVGIFKETLEKSNPIDAAFPLGRLYSIFTYTCSWLVFNGKDMGKT